MNTVLITGSGRGLGLHLANRMSQLGWKVVGMTHAEMDVADAGSVQRAASRVPELDLLINNAMFWDHAADIDVLSAPIDLVLKCFDVNAVGALRVARAFLPALLRSKAGRIVNVSSFWGQITGRGQAATADHPAYRISKAGLNMVTGLLASALKDKGIPVNSVCPAGVPAVEDSVAEIVWAATELGRDQTGKFFHLRKPIDW